MPQTFTKDVIRPGTYWPRGADGKPYRLDVSIDRIRHWSKETNRLIKGGNNIPMPWVHTKEAVPWIEGKPRPGSYDNGAYLKRLRVKKDGTLVAELEAGTDADAEKIGKTVKDVSFYSPPKEWTDGNGKKYSDVFTHLAMVNHPIVVGQENFVPTDGLTLSLSMAVHTPGSSHEGELGNPDQSSPKNRLESILELLSEHGLALPDDTDEMNFTDRLFTALTAVKSSKEQTEGDAARLDSPPEGSRRQQPAPLAMSQTELQFAIDTMSAGVENPATKKSWTADELKAAYDVAEAAKPKLEFSAEQQAQINAVQVQAKMPLLIRIQELVKRKVISPSKAQKDLMPLLESTELTFSQEGEVQQTTPLHLILDTLESLAPGAALHDRKDLNDSVEIKGHKFSLEQGLTVHEHPEDWEEGEGTEDNKKTADRMAAYIG